MLGSVSVRLLSSVHSCGQWGTQFYHLKHHFSEVNTLSLCGHYNWWTFCLCFQVKPSIFCLFQLGLVSTRYFYLWSAEAKCGKVDQTSSSSRYQFFHKTNWANILWGTLLSFIDRPPWWVLVSPSTHSMYSGPLIPAFWQFSGPQYGSDGVPGAPIFQTAA